MKFTQFVRDYLANNKDSGLTYREAMKDDGVRCAYKQYEADLCKKGVIRKPEKRPEPKRRYNKTECGDNVINQTINTPPQFSPAQPQAHPSPPPQVGYQGPPPKAPRGSYAPTVIDQMATSPYYQQNPLIFEEAKKNVLAAMEQAKTQPARRRIPAVVGDDDSTVISQDSLGGLPDSSEVPEFGEVYDGAESVVSYPGSDNVSVRVGGDNNEIDYDNYHTDGGFGQGSEQMVENPFHVPKAEDFPESYQEEARGILKDEEQVKEALDDMLDSLTEKQLNDLKKRYENFEPRTQFFSPRFSSGPLQGRKETERELKPIPASSDFTEEMREEQAMDKLRKDIPQRQRGIRFAPTAMTSGESRVTDRPTLDSDLLETPSRTLPTAEERKRALQQGVSVRLSDDSIDEIRENLRDFDDDIQKRQQGQQVKNTLIDIMENEIRSVWEEAFDEVKGELGELLSAIADESVDEVKKEELSKKLIEEINNLRPTIEAKDIAKSVANEIVGGVEGYIDIIEKNKERDDKLAEKQKKKWSRIYKSDEVEQDRLYKIVEKTSIMNDLERLVSILTNPEEVRKWRSNPESKKALETAVAWRRVSADTEEDIIDEILEEIATELAGANNRYVKKITDKIKKTQTDLRRRIGRNRGKVSTSKNLPQKAVRREGKLRTKDPFDAMDVVDGSGLGSKKERMKDLLSAIIDLV